LFLNFFVEKRSISPRQIILVFLSGMFALVKFNGFIELSAVVIIIALADIFYRRRWPWMAFLFAGSVLFFWMLSGQTLAWFGPFLRYACVLSGGYTEAMMLSPSNEAATLFSLLLALAVIMALTVYAAWKQTRWSGIYPVAGLFVILFMIFKHDCVRHDPLHEITTTLELLLATVACLAVTQPLLRMEKRWIGAGNYFVVLFIFLYGSFNFNRCYREENLPNERLWVDFAWTLNIKNLFAPLRLIRDPGHLQNVYAENLGEIRNQFPLPPIKGTVDVYPWRQAIIFAHGLQYAPRPIIQSYSAFTPELAELNAAHLRGDQAPHNLLFEIIPANPDYPSLADGPSWLEMLSRYEFVGIESGFVWLKHSLQPGQYHLSPLTNTIINFGKSVSIPATNTLVWAELEIHRTFWGDLACIFYKPPALELLVSLRDGQALKFHLNSGMARSGFLLSPLIQNTAAFASLAKNGVADLTESQVTKATVVAETQSGYSLAYQPNMVLRLYQCDIQRNQE
jgi:hypothetical protein